jgi:hypothetical protein
MFRWPCPLIRTRCLCLYASDRVDGLDGMVVKMRSGSL